MVTERKIAFCVFEYIRTYFTLVLTTFKVAFVSTTVPPLKLSLSVHYVFFLLFLKLAQFRRPCPSLKHTSISLHYKFTRHETVTEDSFLVTTTVLSAILSSCKFVFCRSSCPLLKTNAHRHFLFLFICSSSISDTVTSF